MPRRRTPDRVARMRLLDNPIEIPYRVVTGRGRPRRRRYPNCRRVVVIDHGDDVIRGPQRAEDAGGPPPTSHVNVNTTRTEETATAPSSSQTDSVFSGAWTAEDTVEYGLTDWLDYDDSSSID